MLINRQDAINALGEEPQVWYSDDDIGNGMRTQWECDKEAIEALPSAQRKGKWIRMTTDGIYWYECSECHEKPLLNRWHKQDEMSKFCPNCGADMRGEEK